MKQYNVKRLAGYTIDQTILIVSVIAVLVTMIIGSVGWDLLTRAGATKLVSHLRQIEQANGQFYAAHGVWPQDASADGNALCALVNPDSVVESAITGKPRNLLPAYTPVSATACAETTTVSTGGTDSSSNIKHTVSDGFATMHAMEVEDMGDNYLVIEFTNVPAPEVLSADETIDGAQSGTTGRIRYSGTTGKLTMYFIANITDTTAGDFASLPTE